MGAHLCSATKFETRVVQGWAGMDVISNKVSVSWMDEAFGLDFGHRVEAHQHIWVGSYVITMGYVIAIISPPS